MAEQLRFEQRIGHPGAVDRDEGPEPAPAGLVDHPRHDFLADAGFADDQHFGVGPGGGLHFLAEPCHLGAVAQQQRWRVVRRPVARGG